MKEVEEFTWEPDQQASELTSKLSNVGFQSVELGNAVDTILKMKKNGSKVFLTFTSNMVTSGLRSFFSQLIKLGIADVVITTVGGIEEDIMKAHGEDFVIGDFYADDVELYEKGENRVGNIYISDETYERFEGVMQNLLSDLYEEKKRWNVSDMLDGIGKRLSDEDSILYQASENDVPVFCPAITDGSFGFHLYLFQQKHEDFIVDVVDDFSNLLFTVTPDDKKGVIALGGGVSKHHAILTGVLSGGMDYAVYLTTSSRESGSMSGATTDEAKSWGKVKDSTDIVTVKGDVTITFPIIMTKVLDQLNKENLLDND